MSKILDEYLSAAELARQLNRAPATLERWRKRRIGPAPTMVGLHKISTVQVWLQAQERTPVLGQSGRVTGAMKSPSFSWPVAARIWRPSCGEEMPPLTLILKRSKTGSSLDGKSGASAHAAERAWTVEVLNAQVHLDLEVGLTALAVQELGQPLRM